eukprot:COSAG05_NODE_573_length_8601_cov_58.330981_13_plen_85_part_00
MLWMILRQGYLPHISPLLQNYSQIRFTIHIWRVPHLFVMTQALCWMSDRLQGIGESDFSRDLSDPQPKSSFSSFTQLAAMMPRR